VSDEKNIASKFDVLKNRILTKKRFYRINCYKNTSDIINLALIIDILNNRISIYKIQLLQIKLHVRDFTNINFKEIM
jgi:hypothetical protein